MKVGIATVQVPFVSGGAEMLAGALCEQLRDRKIEAEIISMPFKWYPPTRLLDAMLAARLMDLSAVNGTPIDRLITLKFPAYYVDHKCKVGWLLHQHRQAYDLFDTPFGDLHSDSEGRAVAAEIRKWDHRFLPEHRALYTISGTVTNRLRRFNGIDSNVLYPPPADGEKFHCADSEPFILAPGRLDPMKRQHLAIDAFSHLPDSVKLVLIGPVTGEYGRQAADMANRIGQDRIVIRGVVSQSEKIDLYARCLAVYNGVYDEDYGYVTLEAFLAGKPVIAHPDAGGPLEFVRDEENGLIVAQTPEDIARSIRSMADSPALAQRLGANGRRTIAELGIGWDHAIERLLA